MQLKKYLSPNTNNKLCFINDLLNWCCKFSIASRDFCIKLSNLETKWEQYAGVKKRVIFSFLSNSASFGNHLQILTGSEIKRFLLEITYLSVRNWNSALYPSIRIRMVRFLGDFSKPVSAPPLIFPRRDLRNKQLRAQREYVYASRQNNLIE